VVWGALRLRDTEENAESNLLHKELVGTYRRRHTTLHVLLACMPVLPQHPIKTSFTMT
jgi:hypothetical protein